MRIYYDIFWNFCFFLAPTAYTSNLIYSRCVFLLLFFLRFFSVWSYISHLWVYTYFFSVCKDSLLATLLGPGLWMKPVLSRWLTLMISPIFSALWLPKPQTAAVCFNCLFCRLSLRLSRFTCFSFFVIIYIFVYLIFFSIYVQENCPTAPVPFGKCVMHNQILLNFIFICGCMYGASCSSSHKWIGSRKGGGKVLRFKWIQV